MSTWKRKAIEIFPDLRHEFESLDTSIYGVFFELLPRVREAHKRQDNIELQKIYDYAEWCFRQPAQELWNAAAVAFYEHLVDEQIMRDQISLWIKPDIFHELTSLFKSRLSKEEYWKLCSEYEVSKDKVIDRNQTIAKHRKIKRR